MFGIVDTPFTYWRGLIVCSSFQEFSKTKESTLHVIWNVDTVFLLCGADMQAGSGKSVLTWVFALCKKSRIGRWNFEFGFVIITLVLHVECKPKLFFFQLCNFYEYLYMILLSTCFYVSCYRHCIFMFQGNNLHYV